MTAATDTTIAHAVETVQRCSTAWRAHADEWESPVDDSIAVLLDSALLVLSEAMQLHESRDADAAAEVGTIVHGQVSTRCSDGTLVEVSRVVSRQRVGPTRLPVPPTYRIDVWPAGRDSWDRPQSLPGLSLTATRAIGASLDTLGVVS